MSEVKFLKAEMNKGKLIWIRPPSAESGVTFSRKLLNRAGIRNEEMIYLNGAQLRRYLKTPSSSLFRKYKVILAGELNGLSEETRVSLFEELAKFPVFKTRHSLTFVVISSAFSEIEKLRRTLPHLHSVSLFGSLRIAGIDEKIHECIESAAIFHRKPIWRLSEPAAEMLEAAFIYQGEAFLSRLIDGAVKIAKTKKIEAHEVNLSRQLMNLSLGSGEG